VLHGIVLMSWGMILALTIQFKLGRCPVGRLHQANAGAFCEYEFHVATGVNALEGRVDRGAVKNSKLSSE
jgi:hypothetical protein